jgi:HAD superfamily hydrolase (TIGR01509 family)
VVQFLDYNREHIADKSCLYPGMRETLNDLAERSIKMAVITNKTAELSSLLLHALGIHDLFDTISGCDTYLERKPSPLPLLKVAEYLGVATSQCVMVGDSINDIQAAQQAGIASIGCTWGFGGREELAGATILAHSPQELPAAIAAGLRQYSL